jgi:hypothetical protein
MYVGKVRLMINGRKIPKKRLGRYPEVCPSPSSFSSSALLPLGGPTIRLVNFLRYYAAK